MVFSNYIKLEPGIPKRMHFTDYYYVQREIADREAGTTKKVWTHVFYVNEEDGQVVSKTFSIMSQKLWSALEAYEANNVYRDYDFIITQQGTGFYTDFNVQVIKRPES